MKTGPVLASLAVLALTSAACGLTKPMQRSDVKLGRLKKGDSQQTVLDKLGKPDAVYGPKPEGGSTVELDEYKLYGEKIPLLDLFMCPVTATLSCWAPRPSDAGLYWVQLVDGRLERWGKAGGWQTDLVEAAKPENK